MVNVVLEKMLYMFQSLGRVAFCYFFLSGWVFAQSGNVEYRTAGLDKLGNRIVFPSCAGRLYIYDAFDDSTSRVEVETVSPLDPEFSSSGNALYYADQLNDTEWGLFRYDLGSGKRRLTEGFYDRHPTVASDGAKILFTRASDIGTSDESWRICCYDPESQIVQNVTDCCYYRIDGVCDANGRLFFTARKRRSELMSLFAVANYAGRTDVVGELVLKPKPRETIASNVVFSKDRNSLLFASDHGKRFYYDLFWCDLGTLTPLPLGLTDEIRVCMNPMISTERKLIFFLASEGFDENNRPKFGLWSVGFDGAGKRQLLSAEEFASP